MAIMYVKHMNMGLRVILTIHFYDTKDNKTPAATAANMNDAIL